MLIIYFCNEKMSKNTLKMRKIVKVEGEDRHIFWKSRKKQGFAVPLENSFLEKPKVIKSNCQIDTIQLNGCYLKELSPLLVYNSGLTKRDIFTLVTLSTLVALQTIIESRQHAGCGLLKILANRRHSFRYLAVFSLFLHIFFYNFEVKITHNIKL